LAYWTNISATRSYLNQCLAFSFVSIGNFLIIFYLSNIFGILFTLIAILLLNFLLYLWSSLILKKLLLQIKQSYKVGEFPKRAFFCTTAILIAATFLIIPGPISFVVSFISIIFKHWLGMVFSKLFKIDWKDVYEYLKLNTKID
jgi:UPF0716 family protein affecting phage T7 exclusion